MWGHYANHHRGICFEFDARTRDLACAIQVQYSSQYPRFSLADNDDISPFHSKSSDWAYEEEYRLIAQEESEALGPGTLMTRDDGLFRLAPGALVSVIIGCCADDATSERIVQMANTLVLLSEERSEWRSATHWRSTRRYPISAWLLGSRDWKCREPM